MSTLRDPNPNPTPTPKLHPTPHQASTLEAGQPHKPEAGLRLDLVSARAAKLDGDAADAAKYHHLNLHLVSGIPLGATGTLAELAGSQPMSERVRALLRRPESAQRSRRRREGAN